MWHHWFQIPQLETGARDVGLPASATTGCIPRTRQALELRNRTKTESTGADAVVQTRSKVLQDGALPLPAEPCTRKGQTDPPPSDNSAVQSLPAGARFVSAALISTAHPLQRGEECPWFPPQRADDACLLNLPFKIFQSRSCVFQSLAGRRVGESNTIKSHI